MQIIWPAFLFLRLRNVLYKRVTFLPSCKMVFSYIYLDKICCPSLFKLDFFDHQNQNRARLSLKSNIAVDNDENQKGRSPASSFLKAAVSRFFIKGARWKWKAEAIKKRQRLRLRIRGTIVCMKRRASQQNDPGWRFWDLRNTHFDVTQGSTYTSQLPKTLKSLPPSPCKLNKGGVKLWLRHFFLKNLLRLGCI